jgi:hypothetical protein
MNREVHVRFWERLEVKALRATRQKRSDRRSGLPVHPDSRTFSDFGAMS